MLEVERGTADSWRGVIAAACGFADQSHFTRAFRAAMGCSPAAWRRQRRSGVTPDELDPSELPPR